jgi:hypothetical protein
LGGGAEGVEGMGVDRFLWSFCVDVWATGQYQLTTSIIDSWLDHPQHLAHLFVRPLVILAVVLYYLEIMGLIELCDF